MVTPLSVGCEKPLELVTPDIQIVAVQGDDALAKCEPADLIENPYEMDIKTG